MRYDGPNAAHANLPRNTTTALNVDAFDSTADRVVAGRAGLPVALPQTEPGVSLWWSDLTPEQDDLARAAQWLAPAEHARAARFGTEALRRKYIAGRTTLRLVLGNVLGLDPAAVPIRRGPRGRPELALAGRAPDFNISHTLGGAVIGVAHGLPPGARIGVDVEREDRTLAADRLARKFLSADEQASLAAFDAQRRRVRFLRYWTCKEAMSKATGDGLAAPFARLCVQIDRKLVLLAGPPPYVPEAWRLHAAAVPPGYLATLAIWQGCSAHAPNAQI
jgi:4'-phosphopantetheinyl transferase